MAKEPTNHRKPWTAADQRLLGQLAKQNTPTRVMGIKLGRTEDAIQSKAGELGVSLKPTNQRPYGTK